MLSEQCVLDVILATRSKSGLPECFRRYFRINLGAMDIIDKQYIPSCIVDNTSLLKGNYQVAKIMSDFV